MRQSRKEIDLKYHAKELYEIVLDIEKYPDYIPWCSRIDILERKKNEISANMFVNYKFFPTQKFISNVIYDSSKLTIKTKYIDGPLKNLDTKWELKKNKNKNSKILFSLKFEFENYLHQKIADVFFPLVEKKMIESFVKRADTILD